MADITRLNENHILLRNILIFCVFCLIVLKYLFKVYLPFVAEDIFRVKTSEFFASNPDSWPTLEILPGGVIKHSEKYEASLHQTESIEKDLMYACAKCPQRFKFLYNLVKHVRLHESEKRKILSNKMKLEEKIKQEKAKAAAKLGCRKKKRKIKKSKLPKISRKEIV